jgi:hypothetical protein
LKRINGFLCGVLFLLSCGSQAQVAKNDLQARLQEETAIFKQEIESFRGASLIKTADLLTGSGLSDSDLYAVVEAKTKLLISEHDAKPKDKVVAEELNALIRALGSMGTASRELIAGLVESSGSSGIRNRAHRLHPKLDWFAKRNAIMQKPDTYQSGQDLMTHRYLNLLMSDDNVFGRWAMEEMARRGGAEPIVYDKMREILAQEKTSIKSDIHLDYLAWICKLLSQYDAANSAELLNSIKNNPAKDKNAKKLKKYVKI